MTVPALVVPSLGGPSLGRCLEAIAGQRLAPSPTIVVLSGQGADGAVPNWVRAVRSKRRLGFAAAVNAGFDALPDPLPDVALLNDDAIPDSEWLSALVASLRKDASRAAVQGTVLDATGSMVDGRGISLDEFGLPVQVDQGLPAGHEPLEAVPRLAVSATAVLLRGRALDTVRLDGGAILDPSFGSYHEDLDLGLRLARLGWISAWVPGAAAMHVGSATGRRLLWRHPWWLLANLWRALAGNLTLSALAAGVPRLVRGELRAIRSLARSNARVWVVAPAVAAAVPCLVARGLARRSPGPRLRAVPWGRP